MKTFEDLIKNRRSTRQYTEEKLLPEQVEKIMKAPLMAPSSKNSRPCEFILIEDKEMLRLLSLCRPTGASHLEQCALGIVVLSDIVRSSAHIEDASIAATYIQLQAEDIDLGSCWIQISGRETEDGYESEQYVRDLLNIPLQLSVVCIIAVGHKVKQNKPHNEGKLEWEKLHIEKYRPYEQE